MVVIVERTTPPNISISEDLLSNVKLGMSERYNTTHSALNLNAFHKNFAGKAFFAPLWRTNVMVKVIEILTQNIPEVKAIDLSSNKLMTIDSLMPLKHLNNLTILYLSDNKISDTRGLEKLKGEPNYIYINASDTRYFSQCFLAAAGYPANSASVATLK